jgi:hypothetical protein
VKLTSNATLGIVIIMGIIVFVQMTNVVVIYYAQIKNAKVIIVVSQDCVYRHQINNKFVGLLNILVKNINLDKVPIV